MQKKKKWEGERLETFIQSRDTIDHLHRYAIACDYVTDKIVLDIASGEGYGSHLMSLRAGRVFGVDISADAISSAQSKYIRPNLEFRQGSTDAIPLDDASVDIVISFETIEHHDRHDQMLREIKRVLKPGGFLMISTPDKLYYSDRKNFNNVFHVKELYKQEFSDLLARFFSNVTMMDQSYINGVSVIQHVSAERQTVYSGNFQRLVEKEPDPTYLVALASDASVPQVKPSIFDGAEVTSNEMSAKIEQIRRSATYRAGRIFISPLAFVKRLLR